MNIVALEKVAPSIIDVLKMLGTFMLVVLAWVFFRSDNIDSAFSYLYGIFDWSLFSVPVFYGKTKALIVLGYIFLMLAIEWYGRASEFALESFIDRWNFKFRRLFYYILIFLILIYSGTDTQFIYFQF
jgi:alginate O-acetyltransferase complex protein AlgI